VKKWQFRAALEDAVVEYEKDLEKQGFHRGSPSFTALSLGFRDGVTRALRIAENDTKGIEP